MAAQGFIAAGGAELQDGSQVGAREHRLATGAEIVQREECPRRPRHHEAGGLIAESAGGAGGRDIAALQQGAPVDSAGRRRACHKAAAPYLPGDQAFGFEDVVGGRDGGAVQAKQASQFAGGWQALAASQIAGADPKRNVLVELAV